MFIINVEGTIFRDGKWLIIERSTKVDHAGGLLSLVGGTVENVGNTRKLLERTLKRELYEEVGVRLRIKLITFAILLLCWKTEEKSWILYFFVK